jgi:uncharacterized protein YbjT (DUF2867 family)
VSEAARRVLAVGAAGAFAGLVVPELAKRGVRVRGLIQNAQQEPAVRQAGAAEIVIGDLANPADVEGAVRGMDAVFYIAPAFIENEVGIGKGVVDAAKRAGVRRIVFSSVIDPILSALENHSAKAPVEEAILESDMEYTFLHPTLFFQNLARSWPNVLKTGVYGEPWAIESRFTRVDYRDVAEVAAIALTEDRLLHGTFELCAEGDLNRRELAALMSEVFGVPIKAVRAEPPKAPADQPRSPMSRMFDYYDKHGLFGNALTLRAILGREPRTLRAYLGELAASAPKRTPTVSNKALAAL